MRGMRPVSIVLFVIVVSALVGGLFGRSALAVDDKLTERYATFSAALSAIESQYVDKVESDRVVYSAIRGMLSTLDPHSSFFDPREYAQMRERQEGRYYGLGITIQSIEGDITAASVFEGSPAYKVGIRRGDVMARIDNEDAKGWTTEQAMKKLRGGKGTQVKVEIRRRGYESLIPLDVTRDEVQIPTVPAHFMIDATTGYIRHQDWGENTDREMQRALNDLRSKGMKRLLYDIRGNPGGPLDQAIKVSNEFLPKGKMIVYTRGRVRNSDQDYRATEDSTFLDIPMVVLANRMSASASEIFTGALHGRCDNRVHPSPGLGREHRSRDAARAERPAFEGHEAAGLRHSRESRRPVGSGHQGVERIPAEGQDDRLHAWTRPEFRSGLSRDGRQLVPRHPDGRAREQEQRERL